MNNIAQIFIFFFKKNNNNNTRAKPLLHFPDFTSLSPW